MRFARGRLFMPPPERDSMGNPPKKTMVCVTVQKTCDRLIREGAALAGDRGLRVVHVARNGEKLLGGGSDSEALEYLFRKSREYGAEMDMLRSDNVIDTIVELAKKNEVEYLVVGPPGPGTTHDFAAQLRSRLPSVTVFVAAQHP